MSRVTVVGVVAVSLGSLLAAMLVWFGVSRHAAATSAVPIWTEVVWPFPIDPWGKGKAFRCRAADCGNEVNLFLRAKIGFCNCTEGVRDDEDLDRMGDLVLLGEASPLNLGRPISVAWMKGRSRAYTLIGPNAPNKTVLSVVFNERCDMIAATALVDKGAAAAIEPAVIQFLNGTTVMRWAERTLGL